MFTPVIAQREGGMEESKEAVGQRDEGLSLTRAVSRSEPPQGLGSGREPEFEDQIKLSGIKNIFTVVELMNSEQQT